MISTQNEPDGKLLPLAVIGMSFRFPEDAASADGFWKMLSDKRCASKETPQDRFHINAHYHPDATRIDTLSYRGGHFMRDSVDTFDAPFFSIPAAEAQAMDPLHRLTLETSFRAFENAGLPIEQISGTKTAVFAGCSAPDYSTMQRKDPIAPSKYSASGVSINMLSNRVSWFYNLLGPSATVDTACSSSLMAIDMACQSLWSGDADVSLACGSNIILTVDSGLWLDNLGMLSKDSRCFSFDHRANGYGRGEGIGVLVIKPLADAIRDGNTIRAVIRSACSNQDDTYAKAGLTLDTTRYFEAHGTGTPVGDPIEAEAIGTAFRSHRSKDDPLFIGSVKSNIGHLEGAAGVAGVIKTILALENGIIPPNSNFERINPKIDAEFLNIKARKTLHDAMIPEDMTRWPSKGLRRASVQSFGFGGSNSHVILDDAYHFLLQNGLEANHNTKPITGYDLSELKLMSLDPKDIVPQLSTPRLLVWSTEDKDGIERIKDTWHAYYNHPNHDNAKLKASDYISHLAYTLGSKRSHLKWRTFALAQGVGDLVGITEQMTEVFRPNQSPKLGFVFTGQGSQWFGMGRELINHYEVYKRSLMDANDYLRSLGCTWDVLEEIHKNQSETNVNNSLYSQSLCTVVQVALVDLMRSFSIRAAAVIGHSSGEIAAAFSTGAITRESAWKIAYYRGVLTARLAVISSSYGMMAVGLPSKEAEIYLATVAAELGSSQLVIACVNSPKNVTISGHKSHLEYLQRQLDVAQVFAHKLRVDVAYHSFQMREIAEDYLSKIGILKRPAETDYFRGPAMISSVTGTYITADEVCQAEYWVRNLISPVLFSDAFANICDPACQRYKKLDGSHRREVSVTELVEIGPHSALKGPIREILAGTNGGSMITYTSLLVRGVSAVQTTLQAMGHLHCLGHSPNLTRVNVVKPADMRILSTLPEYPFNHSRPYWYENRISKGYRFRNFGVNDLLGTPDSDFNPLEAKWRNIINFSNLPWAEEHKINGMVLYPAAGMLVMAIEAAKQLGDPRRNITGFVIRNTTFHSAVMIDAKSSAGVEVNFHMCPRKRQDEQNSQWHDFRLHTSENGTWRENCNGSIQLVYEPGALHVGIDQGREEQKWHESIRHAYKDESCLCSEVILADNVYHRLRESGYGYGPAFRAMSSISYNGLDSAISEVRTFQPPGSTYQEHVIHPTTLDCVFQGALVASISGGTKNMSTALPTHCDKVWIANRGLSHPQVDKIKCYTKLRRSGMRESETTIFALDSNAEEVLIEIEGFRTTEITSSESCFDETTNTTLIDPLCHYIDWKPDLDLLSVAQIHASLNRNVHFETLPDTTDFFNDVDQFMAACIARVLKEIDSETESIIQAKYHTSRYLLWMRHRIDSLESKTLPEWEFHLDDEYINKMAEKISATNKRGYFFAKVGRNLQKLLTGEMNALELLFRQDTVKEYYYETWETMPAIIQFGRLLGALVHKDPYMKFLEVGAGTGATTRQIMKTLTTDQFGHDISASPRYRQYDYTDLSPFFFSAAQQLYPNQSNRMQFRKLDIEMDPGEQGFECGTYDVIVAAAVFKCPHDLTVDGADSNLLSGIACNIKLKEYAKTLSQTSETVSEVWPLFSGGKLVLWEITKTDGLRTPTAFGLLEGWWLSSEPERKLGPCLDEKGWVSILSSTGFSDDHIILRDYESDVCHEFSLIISTAIAELPPVSDLPIGSKLPDTVTVSIVHNETQLNMATELESYFKAAGSGITTRITEIGNTLEPECNRDDIVIFLVELEQSVWYKLSPETFQRLQKLLTGTSKGLWVSKSNGEAPEFRLIDGISRVINAELDRTALAYLILQDNEGDLHPNQMAYILHICNRLVASDDTDTEYKELDGTLHIPRLVPAQSVNNEVERRQLPQEMVQRKWSADVPLRLTLGSPGLLNTLQFVEDTEQPISLEPQEVEICVKSVGLNFRDILVALGRIDLKSMGCEMAGTITRLGSEVQDSGLKVGDRVVGVSADAFRTFVRLDWRGIAKLPDGMSFSTASAVPVNHMTAWLCLSDRAHLKYGETVLIHSAAGGTGQAAVQVAQYIGAAVFVTVGSESKKDLIMRRYGIPATHIFSSRDTSFAMGVKRLTSGRGVDVILNSLSGERLVASWECIAAYGRFIEIGKKDMLARNALPMFPFYQNASFSAFDLTEMNKERPDMMRKALEEVLALMGDAVLSPAEPLQIYKISELEKAFRDLQSGKSMGKIVVDLNPDIEVTAKVLTQSRLLFDPNATYVISGGLGGIGRSVAHRFVERGARNLILLSRSGDKHEYAPTIVPQLSAKGARVETPACDITDENSLALALDYCLRVKSMPPIKGCIQASMVLHDAPFEVMTFAAWQDAIAPKVAGSWNLHTLLPHGMDFFLMFSSMAAVCGSKAQANYAAGNAFQDGLARYRVSQGERATALDLGPFFSVGFVADNAKLQTRFQGLNEVTEGELFALLEYYCDPAPIHHTESETYSQTLVLRCKPGVKDEQPNYFLQKPLFRHIAAFNRSSTAQATSRMQGSTNSSKHVDFAQLFSTAPSLKVAGEAVSKALAAKLAAMLSLGVSDSIINAPLRSHGVDSLIAVELRNWLAKDVRADISIFELMGGATISAIGALAATRSRFEKRAIVDEEVV